MPADKNLILFSNSSVAATLATSPAVDIGMGGTPQTSPLVARFFYGAAAATGTMTLNVEGSYDNVAWRQIAGGDFQVGPAESAKHEVGIRFVTRRRYVRINTVGIAVTAATATIEAAARSNPEMGLL